MWDEPHKNLLYREDNVHLNGKYTYKYKSYNPPPRKTMKGGGEGGEAHTWQGSKTSGFWKPCPATAYQKAQLSHSGIQGSYYLQQLHKS